MALSLAEAAQQGLSRHQLRSKRWKRIGSKIYEAADSPENQWLVLAAWQRTMPSDAVFAGATAAWVLGLDFEPTEPVDVIVPPGSGTRSRGGLRARRCLVLPEETVVVRGLRATNLTRTLLELCIQLSPGEALVAVDMALARRKLSREALARYANVAAGRAGSARLRKLVSLGEPAESPMETRLRWLFIERGLPRPEVQKELRDSRGRLLGRADLYYASARLVIEFDGGNHKDRLVSDDRRQNLLVAAGYQVLRFTTADLKGRPDVIVAQVRGALAAAARRV